MERFKNTYRIPSARAPWWDYSWRGCYFITICTAQHECILGKIRDGQMQPSPVGEIVLLEWEQSFQIRTELFCDAFVLMPNHLHAIVRIENSGPTTVVVETHGRASLRTPKQTSTPMNTRIAHRSARSISSFVAGFKSSATRMNTIELQIISKPIPKNGKKINSLNRKYYEQHWQKRT